MKDIFGKEIVNKDKKDEQQEKVNVFDFLRDKENSLRLDKSLEKYYNKWIVLKSLSMGIGSILWANEINKYFMFLDNKIFHDYVIEVPKGKWKWAKRDKEKFRMIEKMKENIVENQIPIGTRDILSLVSMEYCALRNKNMNEKEENNGTSKS